MAEGLLEWGKGLRAPSFDYTLANRNSHHVRMYVRSLLSSTYFQFTLFFCSLSFFLFLISVRPLRFAGIISWDKRFQWPSGLRRGSGRLLALRALSLVSVLCCQVEASATGRSLVQGSPTDCCVSLCDPVQHYLSAPAVWLQQCELNCMKSKQ